MKLRHIGLIVKREYIERLRSPGFIIGTILGIIGIAGLSFLPQILQLVNQETVLKVAVVDPRNIVFPYIPKDSAETASGGDAVTQAGGQSVPVSARLQFTRSSTGDLNALSRSVRDGRLGAFVTVEGATPHDVSFKLYARERPGPVTNSRILLLLGAAATQARLRETGISPEQAAALFAPPQLRVEPLAGGSLRDEKAVFQSQALVYVLLILLYGTTVMYGVQVAMGVVWEKSSRVMEILITSIRPIELMLGKVFGIGLVGLTQYALWITVGFVGLLASTILSRPGSSPAARVEVAAVPPMVLIYFLVFFVLGYLVYAALYAALASLVNRTEDVNSITMPVTLVLVGTYLLALAALANPDAGYVTALSFVPFLTPMMMFIRVALASPAWWEPLLAIVLLVGAIFLFAWIAAKIYRVGVLLYGKRPSFREISRLLRAS